MAIHMGEVSLARALDWAWGGEGAEQASQMEAGSSWTVRGQPGG